MSLDVASATVALVALAFALSVGLTALARRIAAPLGLLDRPDGRRKVHSRPIPVLGGVAVFTALIATALAGWMLNPGGLAALTGGGAVLPLLFSAGLACGVGLWDDKRPLRPRQKLLLQFAASLPFVVWGRTIESIHLVGWELELGSAGYAFTAFWLVACANVINLIDGLDGLAGTAGLIITASIAVLAAMKGAAAATVLALVFAGCLLGFLVHNWPPARIFLGDSGSLLIGFIVGGLSIEASLKTATGFALAVPLVLLSVPVFDTAMAIARRLLTGRAIGEGDRQHIHHRLQARGMSRAQALLAISGLCAAMALVTVLSARFNSDVAALGLCVFVLALLVYGRIFGYDETLMFLRRLRDVAAGFAARPLKREVVQLLRTTLDADPQAADDAWAALIGRLEPVGVRQVEISLDAASTGPLRRTWRFETGQRLSEKGDRHPPSGGHSQPQAQDPGASPPFRTASQSRRDRFLDGESGLPQPGWHFRYSTVRSDGLLATVEAAGRPATAAEQLRLAGVLDALVAFCAECLPLADERSNETGPPTLITLPAPPAAEAEPARRARRVA